MKFLRELTAIICGALMVVFPVIATAGTTAKLIPTGKVRLIDSGVTRVIGSTVPVPENTVMMCNGVCVVQGSRIQLAAHDKAIFAVATGSDKWELVVKKGSVDFALKGDETSITVRTPKDVYTLSPVAVPASTEDRVVRGTVSVSSNGKSSLKVTSGAIRVVSSSGDQILKEGMSLQLAQVEMTAEAGAAGGGGFFASLSTAQLIMIGVGTAAAGSLIGWGVYEATNGGGGGEVSPY